MADFDTAYAWASPHEFNLQKHYSNNPADPGGPTNYGITLRTLMGLGSLGDINHDGRVDIQDVWDMQEPDARRIWKRYYWRYDDLNSQAVATKAFDIGINLGLYTAVRYLQTAANRYGQSIAIDGQLGPATVAAVNACKAEDILAELCSQQRNHYLNWLAQKPDRDQFSAGLLARARAIPPETPCSF